LRDLTGQAVRRQPAQIPAILRRLRNSGVKLDATLAAIAMATALRSSDPELALQIAERLQEDGGKSNEYVYTLLIKAYSAAGKFQEALAVELRMQADGVAPTVRTYNSLMTVCARTGDRGGVRRLFARIGEQGIRPTVESWNVVLNYCSKQEGAEAAEAVMKRMQASGYQPDVFSYSALMMAYIATGDAKQIGDVIERMESNGVAMDLVFLNTALDGYARQRQCGLAYSLLARSSKRKDAVVPDETSYAHAIRACLGGYGDLAKRAKMSKSVFSMMRAAGLTPNLRIYSMVLSAQAKAGRLRQALDILNMIRAQGLQPNSYIYSGLLEVALAAGRPKKALAFFAEAEAEGITPDLVLYTQLIRAHLRAGSPEGPAAASEVLRRMKAEGIQPSVKTYTEMIRGCLELGATGSALLALSEMLSSGLTPTRGTYEALGGLSAPGQHPLSQAADPGAGVAFARQAIGIFEASRLPLSGDVYVPALRAARRSGDPEAMRWLLAKRNHLRGFGGPPRRDLERSVREAEAEARAWLSQAG